MANYKKGLDVFIEIFSNSVILIILIVLVGQLTAKFFDEK